MEDTGATLCTLDELTELVGAALAVDYQGAPTGRVRDVPDQRAIRWYVTRGLVDRPAGSRGRVALYGRRHLLQLVAIKRRQAEGRSLAQIQAELSGATDAALADVARLPTGTPGAALDTTAPAIEPSRVERFWAARMDQLTGREPAYDLPPAPAELADAATRLQPLPDDAPAPGSRIDLVQAFRLAPGITLLIDDGGDLDVAAVTAAARPLLDLLAARRGGDPHQEES